MWFESVVFLSCFARHLPKLVYVIHCHLRSFKWLTWEGRGCLALKSTTCCWLAGAVYYDSMDFQPWLVERFGSCHAMGFPVGFGLDNSFHFVRKWVELQQHVFNLKGLGQPFPICASIWDRKSLIHHAVVTYRARASTWQLARAGRMLNNQRSLAPYSASWMSVWKVVGLIPVQQSNPITAGPLRKALYPTYSPYTGWPALWPQASLTFMCFGCEHLLNRCE